MGFAKTFTVAVFLATQAIAVAQTAPTFTQIIVFGDSLSDDGNIRHRAESSFAVSYPGGEFNYSDGRFTNSSDTNPSSNLYAGTWHEQLARTFLNLPVATNSLDGGRDYAFGGATTAGGTQQRTIISNPTPFGGGQLTLTIDNIGRQINQYLGATVAHPGALYAVWGGGNDLFDDSSAASVSATAARVAGLVQRLATAGARNILVPNVPPLGAVPNSAGDPAKVAALDKASADYRSELNTALDSAVSTLAAQGINIQLYRLDIWWLFLHMAADPAKYGFTNITDPSQGDSSVNPDTYLFWDDLHPTTAGHFQIANEANRLLSGAVIAPGKALNVSTRANVGTGENVAIGGFIVTGSQPKRVIIRGIGPSLTANGVSGALADPVLELHNSTGALLTANDNWKDTQEVEIEATTVAPPNDAESAIVQTLSPGNYTAILRGKNDTAGVGLIEVYDLDSAGDANLANVSTRGQVGLNENVMIGGFIVGSGGDATVVIRAIGPSLTSAGIVAPLLDPTLEFHDGNGALIGLNDNWKDTQPSAIQAAQLAPPDNRESAIVASVPPGNYTAVVRGKNNTTGVALVEVYRVQ
jgi:phospholipase/lecithinase/hemolysin